MMCKRMAGISLLLLVAFFCGAQMNAMDIVLIQEQGKALSGADYYQRAGNNRRILQTHKKDVFAKYNPAALALKGVMFTYQHVISPQLSRHCPYEITCSNFSKQAIHEYGIFKGVFLSADRILRCNRIGILDVHPLDFNERTGTIADAPNKYK